MDKPIYDKLNTVTDFTGRDNSYSPMYSSVGLEISGSGIDNFYFHYNRSCRSIFEKTADFPFKINTVLSSLSEIVFGDENKNIRLAFYGRNAFVLEGRNTDAFRILCSLSESVKSEWTDESNDEYCILKGFSENPDARDPDRQVHFICGIKAIKGRLDGTEIIPDENGDSLTAVVFRGLCPDTDEVKNLLDSAPGSSAEAAEKCSKWLHSLIDGFDVKAEDERTAEILACSVKGMLFNATVGEGKLSDYPSAFPSRGGYPCHFLWDTYFQNLGYEKLSADLCKDFLSQIAHNRRRDGKFPQFMCSTWDRPDDSGPPLFGWAVMNIVGSDLDFAAKMLTAIEENNKWWLSERMTPFGLISCPSGLETGQDDSPRFDNGPTVACDMNSYLLSQLHAAAELSRLLNKTEKEEYWNKQADILAGNMVKYLYDEHDNLFYDIIPETGEKIKLVSLVSILPLWAGVNLPEEKSKAMIEDYLLNPEYMFGDIPFPCVAYNQPVYNAGGWWRGPTWMPTAWLMLETLRKFGYKAERNEAAEKIFNMLKKDGEMHELFNSKTGEGMGCTQQGWTCGIFIKLACER